MLTRSMQYGILNANTPFYFNLFIGNIGVHTDMPTIKKMMKTFKFVLILVILTAGGICNPDAHSEPFTYHWEIDETPEGSESATVIEPVEVTLLDEQIQVPSAQCFLSLNAEVFCSSWT